MKFAIKRVDHLGIIAGTIRDLGIIELVDELIGRDEQETISAGEVVAGMIFNGLGFVSRPLMLAPQFFENKALDILIRDGVKAEDFNRHKIGRVLDRIFEYGCEKMFTTIALQACIRENIDMTFGHADTTSYSLSGEYDCESDTETIKVTYGHSKDKRPDLKQIVQELITTQDGGIPIITKTLSGNASDTVILRERVATLINEFGTSTKRYFVADSKLYAQGTADTLNKINFITRVPSTLKLEREYIEKAYTLPQAWLSIGVGYKAQEFSVDLFGIQNQRWVVVHSEQAQIRTEKTLKKAADKERKAIDKALFHLQARRFSCETDAKTVLQSVSKSWKYHQISASAIVPLKCSTKRGRPTQDTLRYEWQVTIEVSFDKNRFDATLSQRSCFILASNIPSIDLSMEQVLVGYKGQDKTEKGFGFLKSPEVFASSLFLKKPSRIEGLLMVMVLSLLVYSIAQRSIRKKLIVLHSTLPNQINQPIQNPTMRWIFQQFEGVDFVTVTINGVITTTIEGITEIRERILRFLSPSVQMIYQNCYPGG